MEEHAEKGVIGRDGDLAGDPAQAGDIPNTQAASALPWGQYRTSVDAIEAASGLNFFDRIPTAVQNHLEGGVCKLPLIRRASS